MTVQKSGFAFSAGVSLLLTAGLMQLSTLVVGGDTGALHLATAQGRRVVMLVHNHRRSHSQPFRQADWVLLPPVDDQIASITLPMVIAACEPLLIRSNAVKQFKFNTPVRGVSG